MKHSYLFLDIDGVLNCYSDAEKLFLSEIEKKSNTNFKIYKSADFVCCRKLRLFQDIVTQTGCQVIGISSWFNSKRDPKKIGKFLNVKIFGVVEYTGGGVGRTKAIQKFLEQNGHKSFVVLDDQQIGHDIFGERHVCPQKGGLTEELQQKCIELLGEKQMNYGKHLTVSKAVVIVENMKQWKEKNKGRTNAPPCDYTSYAASLQLLKDKGFNV